MFQLLEARRLGGLNSRTRATRPRLRGLRRHSVFIPRNPRYSLAMPPFIEQHREELAEICRRYHVRRLELFGSGSRGALRPDSDLDFVVTFGEIPDGRYFRAYFGLIEALTKLFGRRVDLVEEEAVTNPYFLPAIAPSRTLLYAA